MQDITPYLPSWKTIINAIFIYALIALPFAIHRAFSRSELFFKAWWLFFGLVFVLVATFYFGLRLYYEFSISYLSLFLMFLCTSVIALGRVSKKKGEEIKSDDYIIFKIIAGLIFSFIIIYSLISMTSRQWEPISIALQPTTTRYPTRLPSPTYRPVPTTTHRPPRTPTPWQPPTSSNPYNNCHSWDDITLADLGDEYCVMGTVRRHWSDLNQWASFITFGNKPHHFYMVTYDPGYLDIVNYCVMAIGTIERIGSAPVMVIDYGDLFYCN